MFVLLPDIKSVAVTVKVYVPGVAVSEIKYLDPVVIKHVGALADE